MFVLLKIRGVANGDLAAKGKKVRTLRYSTFSAGSHRGDKIRSLDIVEKMGRPYSGFSVLLYNQPLSLQQCKINCS